MATGADRLLATQEPANEAVAADRRRCADLATRLSDSVLESRNGIAPSHEAVRLFLARFAQELVVLARSVREGDDAHAFEQNLLDLGPLTAVGMTGEPVGLIELVRLAHAKGLGGFAVLNQRGGERPFVGLCVNFAGQVCDPRTVHTYPTPEEALGALLVQMRKG